MPAWQIAVGILCAIIYNIWYIELMSKHPMVMSKIAIGFIELLLLLAIALPVLGSMNVPAD
jgi:hypothetical protein